MCRLAVLSTMAVALICRRLVLLNMRKGKAISSHCTTLHLHLYCSSALEACVWVCDGRGEGLVPPVQQAKRRRGWLRIWMQQLWYIGVFSEEEASAWDMPLIMMVCGIWTEQASSWAGIEAPLFPNLYRDGKLPPSPQRTNKEYTSRAGLRMHAVAVFHFDRAELRRYSRNKGTRPA